MLIEFIKLAYFEKPTRLGAFVPGSTNKSLGKDSKLKMSGSLLGLLAVILQDSIFCGTDSPRSISVSAI